jgi:16S rRNA (guanine527-N7)-methyltransferase
MERLPKRSLPAFDENAVHARLQQGVQSLGLSVDAMRMAMLVRFVEELNKANQIHNLTAIREPLEMVDKHVLDSLAAAPYLMHEHLIDVGSGGGVPGLPLLLAGVVDQVTMIDSVAKKMRTVAEIAARLGVGQQIRALHTRVEDLAPEYAAQQVISRAFASVEQFAILAGHLVKPHGQLLAMKGKVPNDELAHLPAPWKLAHVHPLQVPFLDAERCLVVLKR